MTIGDVHLLVAQARQEAADPGFKVHREDWLWCDVAECSIGLLSPVRLHWKEISI